MVLALLAVLLSALGYYLINFIEGMCASTELTPKHQLRLVVSASELAGGQSP